MGARRLLAYSLAASLAAVLAGRLLDPVLGLECHNASASRLLGLALASASLVLAVAGRVLGSGSLTGLSAVLAPLAASHLAATPSGNILAGVAAVSLAARLACPAARRIVGRLPLAPCRLAVGQG